MPAPAGWTAPAGQTWNDALNRAEFTTTSPVGGGITYSPAAPGQQLPGPTQNGQNYTAPGNPGGYAPNVGSVNYGAPAPQTSNSPSVRPQTYAGGGNGIGINQAWAWDTVNRYNPQYNSYLEGNYNQAVENWQMNGSKGPAPQKPNYTNTNYDTELNHIYANTPGFEGMGSDAGYDYSPYLSQPGIYGTPNKLPAPTTSTSTNPVSGKQVAAGGGLGAQQLGAQQMPQIPMVPQSYWAPTSAGQNNVPNGSALTGQGNMSGFGQFLSLLALLGGGGQKQQTPFFNNNRSTYYPTTNKNDSLANAFGNAYPGPAQNSQSQNPIAMLLSLLLGGA